jgi:hypothetical protein
LEVIEQPLQQIMKTPMIFHEPTTHLTKPKKKSTYSDAVGKKNEGGGGGGGGGGASSGPGPSGGSQPLKAVQAGGMGSHPPPSSVTAAMNVGAQPPPLAQHKINLAPGTRPVDKVWRSQFSNVQQKLHIPFRVFWGGQYYHL